MGLIKCNNSYEGERIENKIRKALDGTENLEMGKPAIFGERKVGVIPSTDIRTDRWDLAIEAQEHVNQTKTAEYDRITIEREGEPTQENPTE